LDGIGPPRLLEPTDPLDKFDCDVPVLNQWLRRRALSNHVSGASRTYVAPAREAIAGFYCLAAGSLVHAGATGAIRRNMPDPIPAIVLGRLAVDLRAQGQGVGFGLMAHALDTVLSLSRQAGIRTLLVHAKDAPAAAFYRKAGFVPSPLDDLVLMVKI
jgi:GNAT superfamily N-acetyltransferase